MSFAAALTGVYSRLGDAERTFECCDTTFRITASGYRSQRAANRAQETVRTLERQLNAFDDRSAVAKLNETGRVENDHVARLVERGLEYLDRTDGVFDIRHGTVEHHLKAYLRGDSERPPDRFESGAISVDADRVCADVPLDLNGLAKGYIVDRAATVLDTPGRTGFVSGGGDLSPPPGPVGIDSPFGDSRPLKVVDTDWNVATSGGYRRHRDGIDHIYDPTTERVGSRHDSVTVVAVRDCMEADALATTLAAQPVESGLALIDRWPGAEAFVVHDGVFHESAGFDDHVLDR